MASRFYVFLDVTFQRNFLSISNTTYLILEGLWSARSHVKFFLTWHKHFTLENLPELIFTRNFLTFNFLWCKESIKVVCSQSQWHIGQDATVHEGPAEAVDGHAEQEDGVVGRPQRRRDPHLDVPLKKYDSGLTDVSTNQSNNDYVKCYLIRQILTDSMQNVLLTAFPYLYVQFGVKGFSYLFKSC